MHQAIEQVRFQAIHEILQELDEIIEETVQQNNFLGIFAYVYRRTTAEIQKAVEEKRFEDNQRMVQFDIAFASYYLNAYHHYLKEKPVSLSWKRAFHYSERKISILQHILLGMNAHINLDLGIAAAKVSEGTDIIHLKNDFMLVNQILADLVDEIQLKIGKVSPLMFVLDWLGGRQDEQMISFNIIKARHHAWKVACTLAKLNPKKRKETIDQIDREMAHLAYRIYKPPLPFIKAALKVIQFFEEKRVAEIIKRLK